MSDNKFRLVTRSDFDGMVCAVLLSELDMIGELKLVHPKDMQDGAVDTGDSAQFQLENVLNPKRWVLLNFLMDVRTGLGWFREFKISNYQLMMDLISYCRKHTIEEILWLSDIKERVDIYFENEQHAKEQIKRCAVVHDNLVVLDIRNEKKSGQPIGL